MFGPTAAASTPPGEFALVVEDDPAIGSLFRLLLSATVKHVVHVRTTAECMAWFAENAAATKLVVMDCSLPDGHGSTLAHRLRTQRPGIPLLLTSGRAQPAVVKLLAADGPTLFLPKPFRPVDVAERAGALLAAGVAA